MGRVGNAPACLASVAAVACLLVLASCGGGGDEGTSSVKAATMPGTTTTAQRQTPDAGKFRPDNGSTSTAPAPSERPRPGAGSVAHALAPFNDCLTRNGVDVRALRSGGWREQSQDPAKFRAQLHAAAACIPELPPRMRKAAERIKRRLERRFG